MKMAGIIFSNIYDNTMAELTKHRTMASVPFGGRYRHIDFVLSNMVNSGIQSVGAITKYHYKSLMDHLGTLDEWDLDTKTGGFYLIPPFLEGQTSVYRGKIEALSGAMSFVTRCGCDYVLLSDSTVICNIDYDEILEKHVASGKDVTVIANRDPHLINEPKEFVVNAYKGKVIDVALNCVTGKDDYIGMGMFIMSIDKMVEMVNDCVSRGKYHFEKDFIQKEFNDGTISLNLYEFKGTVLRNNCIVSYFENSMKLLDYKVRKEIFSKNGPIYTKVRDEKPTYYGTSSEVDNCIIADGCDIRGKVENCVIFRNVTIEEGAVVKNSIIIQGTTIKKDCNIEYVVADKDVVFTEGRKLIGAPTAPVIINKGETV